MLIQKFTVPEEEMMDVGLRELNMSRLGRFVGLAGKNGSGKTRLLKKLEFYISVRTQVISRQSEWEHTLEDTKNALKNDPNSRYAPSWKERIDEVSKQLSFGVGRLVTLDAGIGLKSIRFVPKDLNLVDPRNSNLGEIDNRSSGAKSPGVDGLAQNCLFYIQQLQTRAWNAGHQNYMGLSEEKEKYTKEYNSFKELLNKILNVTLERDIDGYPVLFGKRIPDSNLSDGQKILLQLCVALHAQHIELNNAVFILDEPENHLHPSAVIDLLKTLYDVAPNSQIWVATHSVPLLSFIASVEPMSLWFVNDGFVKNAGRHPEIVLSSLLGDRNAIAQLNIFTGLPAQLAAINYACESLLPPKAVTLSEKDPQVNQIQNIINNLLHDRTLSILDYGAGKGRLLDGMAADFHDLHGKIFSESISYYAFDPFNDDKEHCTRLIRSYYTDEVPRYFNTDEEFFSKQDDMSIDIVVLCNVLHEISPRHWISLFSNESLIMRSLKDDGYILIVEDQRIPVGEKAHDYGFLVLDTSHLRTLFCITNDDANNALFSVGDVRGDGRLKSHLISKSLLGRITSETIKKSITQLNNTARTEIKRIRSLNPSYENGQLNGFWTQQFANTSLFLSEV